MKTERANQKIRAAARSAGVAHWAIAAELGISEATFCRMLRTELQPEKAAEIMAAIDAITGRAAG